MALVVGLVLALLSIGVAAYPFVKSRAWSYLQSKADRSAYSESSLESVFEDISTLQLDHQLGKIPEALYQEQLQAYRLQAALLLREQDLKEYGEARRPDAPLECPVCGEAVLPGYDDCPRCSAPAGSDAGSGAGGTAK